MNSPPSIPIVLTQHAEEAAFQWILRDDAVFAPHYSLRDLADLDNRLDAHLDGLRIAGEAGWEVCKEQLSWEEPGEVFAAGMLALESEDEGKIQEVLEAGTKSLEVARGMISALGWVPYRQAATLVRSLLESGESLRQRVGIAAAAVHRQDLGALLITALSSEPPAGARVLRAAGELGRVDLLRGCQDDYGSEDLERRFWGAWSGALLGDLAATEVLREIAESGGPRAERAADLFARRARPAVALSWQKHLASRPEWKRLAIVVAGANGDPTNVPWLLEMMKVDALARPAGEAFSFITGLDLSHEDLEGEWPESFEAGPTENPEDEDVSMDGDEDLPWPAPVLIQSWWGENRSRFSSNKRYLLGKPMTASSLADVLNAGRQRQRAAAALELALLEPKEPLFEVRARGEHQLKMLKS